MGAGFCLHYDVWVALSADSGMQIVCVAEARSSHNCVTYA